MEPVWEPIHKYERCLFYNGQWRLVDVCCSKVFLFDEIVYSPNEFNIGLGVTIVDLKDLP